MVTVSLSYSPKTTTLKKKFGNLPLKYIRMNIESESEISLFEKAVKRYTFDIDSDDEEIMVVGESTSKKLKYNEDDTGAGCSTYEIANSKRRQHIREVFEEGDEGFEPESQIFIG